MNRDWGHYFQELKTHLPLVKDPTVIILRGHLLIEDLLDQLIAASLENASAIKNARLTFFQKFCIAQGIVGFSNKDDIWKPIGALNKLRNTISHNLPNETLSKEIAPVLRTFFPYDFGEIPADIYSKSKALRKGIIFHCAMLSGFIDGIKTTKKHLTRRSTGSPGNPAPGEL